MIIVSESDSEFLLLPAILGVLRESLFFFLFFFALNYVLYIGQENPDTGATIGEHKMLVSQEVAQFIC